MSQEAWKTPGVSLSPGDLKQYQRTAIQHVLTNPVSSLWLDMGLGKQQPKSEPVLTPSGFRPIGNLVPGDLVIGANGKPTAVVGVYPQESRSVWRVEFSDGSWTRAGLDHLWSVQNNSGRLVGKPPRVMSTHDLLSAGLFDRKNGNRRWFVPMTSPVEFYPEKVPLLVEPYLLGVLLGDGTIGLNGAPSICSDTEILRQWSGYSWAHGSDGISYLCQKGLRPHLRALGLAGKRSWEKFIPNVYLVATPKERLALLQGLLDTDGSPITSGGGVEFSSTSEDLADGVVFLAQSLGGVARKKGPRITHHQGGEGRPSWRVNVKLPSELDPFRLSRKLAKWQRPTKYHVQRRISAVYQVEDEDCVCIQVDASDGLYLTRGFIVTHNTVTCLTAFSDLLDRGAAVGALVVAPLRVIQTVWRQEARKWSHTRHLTFSLVHGTEQQRMLALRRPATIYLTNPEQLPWLADYAEHLWLSKGRYPPWNVLILDEITRFKSSTAKRSRALQRLVPYSTRRVGLTGEPAANGYVDLFGQYLVLDQGQRLGTTLEGYRTRFLTQAGWGGMSWAATKTGQERIHAAIADITLEQSAVNHLDLPPITSNVLWVELPPKARKVYDTLEKALFVELDSGRPLEVQNEANLVNKLLQVASGAAYLTPGGPWEEVHRAKLEALQEVLEEAGGRPVLLGYTYVHEAARIERTVPEARFLSSKLSEHEVDTMLAEWGQDRLPLLCGHPASCGHGLNLQGSSARALVWFSLPWSLELYKQMNARMFGGHRRQGESTVHHILAEGTMDEVVFDVLHHKEVTQETLKRAVNAYREKRGL